MTSSNSSFSPILPTLQVVYDATSIGEARLCDRRYKYSIVDGYQPRDTNVHLFFGSEYAKSFERYHHYIAGGQSHKDASERVISQVLTDTWRKDLGRPWPSDDPNKNRNTLIRSVSWYLKQFEDDPLETVMLRNGKPAVELHFNYEMGYTSHLTGEQFCLSGHLDRVALFERRPAIVDQKTTKYAITSSYFARFNPDTQVSAYLCAGSHILGEPILDMVIDAAQVLVHSTRFQRGVVGRTPAQLDEWIRDLFPFFERMERNAEKNQWPMNDKACGLPHTDPKTGEVRYGCPYREVCSADPSMRDLLLRANFTQRTWDPAKPRELENT